jgi:hypothetical protein
LNLFGRSVNEIPKRLLWITAVRTPDFYTNLPWTSDGKELWSYIKDLNPTILTAAPKGSWAEKQKRKWVDRELGEHVPMIVSTRKYEHCPPTTIPAILIDDKMIHCQAWEDAGGIAVLHQTARDTIEHLQDLGIDAILKSDQFC